MCSHCRGPRGTPAGAASSWELSAGSRQLAGEMLRKPIGGLSPMEWNQAAAADLRKFLVEQIESHAERKLYTARMLEAV